VSTTIGSARIQAGTDNCVIYPVGGTSAEILLINVPQRHYTRSSPRLPAERVLPPLGLAYLATYLERSGITAAVLDGEYFGLTSTQIIQAASAYDVRAYGINCYSPTAPLTYEIALGLAELEKPVFIGGVHATYCEEDVRRSCPFARVIKGYGEEQLFRYLTESERPSKRERLDPLSIWLSRPHLAADPFRKRGVLTSSLMSSRGCPYTCTFCTSAQTRYTLRDVTDVAREIRHLVDTLGVTHFQFLDDLFLLNPSRTLSFIDATTRWVGPSRITWQGLATVKTLHLHNRASLIRKLREHGCVQLSVGFESGSKRIRHLAGKQYDDQTALDVVKACDTCGIRLKGFFMLGFPGERREEIGETIRFIFRLKAAGLKEISLFQVKLYPGTQLLQTAIQQYGPTVVDNYYEYDLRELDTPVAAMRALSRESYGTRTRLAEVDPQGIEELITETTKRFYED
jgi:radical SAM superfamily enzyme YgiQ (UPF0313 family)